MFFISSNSVLLSTLTFKQGAEMPPASNTSLRCELSHCCLQEEHWDTTREQKQDIWNQKCTWEQWRLFSLSASVYTVKAVHDFFYEVLVRPYWFYSFFVPKEMYVNHLFSDMAKKNKSTLCKSTYDSLSSGNSTHLPHFCSTNMGTSRGFLDPPGFLQQPAGTPTCLPTGHGPIAESSSRDHYPDQAPQGCFLCRIPWTLSKSRLMINSTTWKFLSAALNL